MDLQHEIETYPDRLRKALIEKARCEALVERLTREITSDPDDGELEDDEADLSKEVQRELSRLDTQIEKLRIRLEEAEGKASVQHRSAFLKATDASTRAAVNCDEKVVALRLQMRELREKRAEFIEAHVESGGTEGPVDTAEYLEARAQLAQAEAEVVTLASMTDVYRLLVDLHLGKTKPA